MNTDFRPPTFHLTETNHPVFYHYCWAAVDRINATLPNTKWHVVEREPLTVEPSIHCLACGLHGFIRHGEWVPA